IKFTPTKFEWHMNGNGDDNLDYDDIPADVWLHHTVVKTADQLTYYRNGVEHSSGIFTQPLDVPQPLYFGGDNEGSAGENWSGLMSDVAIYDRALSEAEIRYLAGERVAPVDVTAPGDIVQGVPNDGDWPGAETPDLAIDDDTGTKYLHFKGETEPTGFQIEPASGASIVTGLTLTTANDATERDPISFELSGSNESIDGPYTLIASGDIVDFAQEVEWPRFTMNATPIMFDNDVAYKYYQVMFPAVRDAASANSMQIAEIELLGTGPFTAYNDCVYDADQDGTGTDPTGQAVHYIAPNVTTFGVGSGFSGSSSGELLDQKTGNPTGVIATLTESGGVVWQPQNSGSFTGGYDTAVGTDAYDTFNGIADMTGVIYYGSTGWYVDLTLTGLNPNRTYTFATSASRSRRFTDGGGDGYADRNSIYTISGVDAATNASTPGTEQYLDDPLSVWFNTGNNHDEGYVARWTDINPGPDGSFTVRAEAHPDSNDGGRKAYTFDVFTLQELAN
ncbi:MAG: LamG domain-containing protein, partial [Planctomycetes bacterium]|nr:LamG domain-containing protein [Planctomycetota bacterium]